MSTQLMLVIFTITLIAVEAYDCGPNAVLKCDISSIISVCRSRLTCDKYLCGQICVCKTNYVKNADGRCEPKKCFANSSFKKCRKIHKYQCLGPITTHTDGPFVADCVCNPGSTWFNDSKGCLTLAQRLNAYSHETWTRFG